MQNIKQDSRLQSLIQQLDEVSLLTTAQKKHRINALQRMLKLVFPMIVLAIGVRLSIPSAWQPEDYAILLGSLVLNGFLYLVTRTERYYFIMGVTIIFGALMVIYNAYISEPPHIEILYLVITPLTASIFLSLYETILSSIIASMFFFAFGIYQILPVDPLVFRDVMIIFLILNTFIVYGSYTRNRLENERFALLRTEERSKTLEYLVNSISHDFKTPLSVISTSVHMIDKMSHDEGVTKRTEKIKRQVNRLDSMVQSVLRLSKLEFDMSESLAPCHIGHLATQAVQEMTAFSEIEQVTLRTDIDLNVSNIRAHPENILRIITNLIDNAIRYTPKDGTVHIRVFEDPHVLCLEVQDTGIGIAPENITLIFEPFYRVDEARSSETAGTGVGLALVKRTVELYGASIDVASVLGEGSTFTVKFPHYR